MTRLDRIEARLQAARSVASDRWEVDSLSTYGGYAVVATDAMDVRTDGYLPEEAAEMFANAPADLAALAAFAREVEEMAGDLTGIVSTRELRAVLRVLEES